MYLQMAQGVHKTSAKYANVLLTGEVTGKNVTDTVKVFQKDQINFKKCMVIPPTFYVMKWKWQAYSTRDQFLVMSKRYLDYISAEPEEGCQRR